MVLAPQVAITVIAPPGDKRLIRQVTACVEQKASASTLRVLQGDGQRTIALPIHYSVRVRAFGSAAMHGFPSAARMHGVPEWTNMKGNLSSVANFVTSL